MNTEKQREILRLLDWERQTIVYPGMTRISEMGVIKDISSDGKSAEIVYTSCTESDVDRVIKQQIDIALREGYELEWKLYGHDQPPCLGERLTAAGFEAGDVEAFMVFVANEQSLSLFGAITSDIRRVTPQEGLRDYQLIREEVRGKNCEQETEQYRWMLENHPDNMSVYVAYVEGEPAVCGRIYFHQDSQFAGLYGGCTREKFRKRGLFTQLVASRIREAVSRGIRYITVDALPTSEPILAKQGFVRLTYTQPYFLSNEVHLLRRREEDAARE